jgi:hypothetical protein
MVTTDILVDKFGARGGASFTLGIFQAIMIGLKSKRPSRQLLHRVQFTWVHAQPCAISPPNCTLPNLSQFLL